MLPDPTLPLPASLMALLAAFQPLFTVPSFRTFCALAAGFLAQTGRRTVCGMLTGAGLSQVWRHDRAHQFFSRARWSVDDVGLAAAKLVVALLVPAVVVRLPMINRPVAVPVLAKLVIKDTNSASRLWLARRMARMIAGALPGRAIRVVADAAYAGKELKKLPPGISWTTRLRKDAALYDLPPERTGRRGRPRAKGARLPSLAKLADGVTFAHLTVTRYDKTATIQVGAITCLWYSVFGSRPVQVVLIRDTSATGYYLALVTSDPGASPAQVIERYAARWSIEVAIEESKQVFGTEQARNRAARAVERTVPFQFACQAVATAGHDPADVEDHRVRAPWYTTKTRPSTADMLAKLRRVLIAARFRASYPGQPTPEEIHAIWLVLPTSLSDDQAAPLHEHGTAAVDDHGADCSAVLADPDSAIYGRVKW